MKKANIYGLNVGENLRVYKNFVIVHSIANRDYRVYNFEGTILGKFTEAEYQSSIEPAYIQFQDSMLIKKDAKMQFITYEGDVICDAVTEYDFTYKKDEQEENVEYVIITTEAGKMAIYSQSGECILAKDNYSRIRIENDLAFLTLKNDLLRIYDLKNKVFIGETYTSRESYYPHIIFHDGEKSYFFDAVNKSFINVDMCYVTKENFKDITLWSIYLYKDGACGLWFKLRGNAMFQVLPIEYRKISVTEKTITAKKGTKVQKLSLREVIKANTKPEDKIIHVPNTNTNVNVNIFGITLHEDERLFLQENFFGVIRRSYNDYIAVYYNLDGVYIGKSYVEEGRRGLYPQFMEYGKVLILSETKTNLRSFCEWKLYNCTGDRISKKKYSIYSRESTLQDSEKNCMLCYCNNRENPKESEVIGVSPEGKILFRLEGFKDIEYSHDNFFLAEDYSDKIWVFDMKGNLIFKNSFERIESRQLPLIIQKEGKKSEYTIYDCYNKTKETLQADNIVYSSESQLIPSYHRVYLNGKEGLFTTRGMKKGFKEMIPIEYQSIKQIYNPGSAHVYWLAQTEEKDDIYDDNGTMILTTEK